MGKRLLVSVLLMYMALPSTAMGLSLNGVTDFASVSVINAATRGVIKTIAVVPGQRINKGDVLISLDDTTHQARLQQATAISRALKPIVTIAALELERAEELYALDSLSQVDLQNAENKLARAEGDYQAAQAELSLAAYEVEQTVIRAPFNGRVLQVYTSEAVYVDPAVESIKLISVAETSRLIAKATVNQQQWSNALLNKPATIQYRDKSYQGTVSYLDLQGRIQNDGSRLYELHVSFESSRLIPAGMPVTLKIGK